MSPTAQPNPAAVAPGALLQEAPVLEALFVPKALWLAALLAVAFSYLMFSENGAVLTQHWTVLHEFFHDGRHVFGVPCH